MVDVFEYDGELRLKCLDGEVRACKNKIVTLGTGDFSARGAITVGGTVDSAILAFGVNGYRGKVTGKTKGNGGLEKYIIEFDLTNTGPDLLKKGYDKERAVSKIGPTGWAVA
jgi:hypothetical protein